MEDPNCNFVPKQMTRDELVSGYRDLVKRLYTPEAFLERYFKVFKHPEFLARRAEICRKAGEGKSSAHVELRAGAVLVVVLDPVAGRFVVLGRQGLSASTSSTATSGISRDDHRLRAVHEPLRDPLALLQVHPRNDRRPPAPITAADGRRRRLG